MAPRKSSRSGNSKDADTPSTSDTNSLIEWIIAAISAAMVVALIGFFAYEAIFKPGDVPMLSVSVSGSHESPSGTAIAVSVVNNGHATAAAVEITGEAASAGTAQSSQVTLDYVPAESTREATLLFEGTIDPESVTLRVLGYAAP